jgi:hypothetical protein
MQKKLNDSDGHVVDLLVERATTGEKTFTAATPAIDEKRLNAVENVFKLLSLLPEEPVPVDLLARTLKRLATTPRTRRAAESEGLNLPSDPGPAA